MWSLITILVLSKNCQIMALRNFCDTIQSSEYRQDPLWGINISKISVKQHYQVVSGMDQTWCLKWTSIRLFCTTMISYIFLFFLKFNCILFILYIHLSAFLNIYHIPCRCFFFIVNVSICWTIHSFNCDFVTILL